jgi:signal transduction histidine kinase
MTPRTVRRTVRGAVSSAPDPTVAPTPADTTGNADDRPARPPGLWGQLLDPRNRWQALWPAVVLAAFEVMGTVGAGRGQPDARALDPAGIALVLAAPVALVWRRTVPLLPLAAGFVSVLSYVTLDYPKGPIFLGIAAAYVNAVLHGWRRVPIAALGAGWIVAAWLVPLQDGGPWPDWPLVVGLGAWMLVLGSASELLRARLERAAERRAARAELARRRVSEERVRIARELHDVLAHDISLINVRAGVALHLVDDGPDPVDADQVRAALAAIKDASKDALGELRSALDVLRQGESAAPLAPTAGLRDLDGLVERARGTGLDVRLERVDGRGEALEATAVTDGLPAGVDLAALRIVQEALTNVVRHAGATRATVRVRRSADEIEVRVDDDGVGLDGGDAARDLLAEPEDASGRGIAGMRERALALGGTAEAGPRPGRGFRVRARLPLQGVAPDAGGATGSGAATAATPDVEARR